MKGRLPRGHFFISLIQPSYVSLMCHIMCQDSKYFSLLHLEVLLH